MIIRPLESGELEALQAKSKLAYDKAEFPAEPEEAFVLEDESGTPRAIFLTERVAEVYLLLDHEWGNPARRWAEVRAGIKEVSKRLTKRGYRAAYGVFEEGVPQGYLKRLSRECGGEVKQCVRFTR